MRRPRRDQLLLHRVARRAACLPAQLWPLPAAAAIAAAAAAAAATAALAAATARAAATALACRAASAGHLGELARREAHCEAHRSELG